ncbi:unnamed protein product [Diabrotica balteata]|uniref:Fringe-like glycosyltransferase domain-containing protein n=1 Tax=Diabrotica balteata TaxID=107213 RepID=A0A9N9X9Y8_DIABA|nr:unnamed protein product [Diabrotica balteata]
MMQISTNEQLESKPFYLDRNLAEDRSQTEYEPPQDYVGEIVTATAKPPSTTLDDVFISVKTTKTYHNKRLPIILKTWFQLARKQKKEYNKEIILLALDEDSTAVDRTTEVLPSPVITQDHE